VSPRPTGRGFPWWTEPASLLGTGLLTALGLTWRVGWLDPDGPGAAIARSGRCIFALWHSRLMALTFTHRHRGVAVLVSQHRDGELITRVIERWGYVAARGSSTRGGEEGTRELLESASQGRTLAITPDGPRGPAEMVKPGLVYLASRSGLPVIPVAAAGRPEWRLRSWDGFRVPKPFSRVNIVYGAPMRVPPDLSRADLETWRTGIERALAELTRELDRRAESGT
jgi:hypothetical protein